MTSPESASAGPSSARPTAAVPGLQPFQCSTCSKRFTRHENLKRHVSIHANSANSTPFPCPHCTISFSRQDLRRRHVKKKHPDTLDNVRRSPSAGMAPEAVGDDEPMNAGSGVFDYGQEGFGGPSGPGQAQGVGSWAEAGPSGPHSTVRAAEVDMGQMFDFSNISTGFTPIPIDPPAPVDIPPTNPSLPIAIPIPTTRPVLAQSSSSYHSSFSTTYAQSTLLDPSIVSIGVHLFFKHVAAYCPFIHQPTFDPSTAPDILLLAMLSVSMQFGENTDEGKVVGRRCFSQARKVLEEMDETSHTPAFNLQTVQACLLLQLCAIMMLGGSETKHGLRLHARCIEMVRLCGLTEPYPAQPDMAGDLDALWSQFARAESHKRTFYGVYQLDATWYQILSTPRHMSHLEIKHELPCSSQLWAAPSSTAWAHCALIDRPSSPKYITTIRNCLTPSPQTELQLDAHGSLLVIFFLLSSVREVSGWSTMTGRICFERFEALHASLKSLEPRVCGKSDSDSVMGLSTEAMWHMAMMDLLLWSPAHTHGVVEYSMDAAIAATIHFGILQPVGTSVESLNPHLDWFLTYLDNNPAPQFEAPWITIYAFKAALVAWQLVKLGLTDHVDSLGVVDAKGMCAWIKRCFQTRTTWGIGGLIMKSMEELEMASL